MKKQLSNEISANLSINTKEKFLKVSKKLHKNIQQSNGVLSLSIIQESLSKALGFRNFNELEKLLALNDDVERMESVVANIEQNTVINNLENFLKAISPQVLTNIIMKEKGLSDTFWYTRATTLLNLVSNILYKYVLNKDKFENLDLFRNLLVLDNLTFLYAKVDRAWENKEKQVSILIENKLVDVLVDKNIVKAINDFLITLPGFLLNKRKQSETCYEQHGFLTMQAIRGIGDLEFLENDICIYHESWIDNELFKNNTFYYSLITDIYKNIKNNRNSFFSKYKTSNDSIHLSDIYYYYGTMLDQKHKNKLEDDLSLIIQNIEMLKEISLEMNSRSK